MYIYIYIAYVYTYTCIYIYIYICVYTYLYSKYVPHVLYVLYEHDIYIYIHTSQARATRTTASRPSRVGRASDGVGGRSDLAAAKVGLDYSICARLQPVCRITAICYMHYLVDCKVGRTNTVSHFKVTNKALPRCG